MSEHSKTESNQLALSALEAARALGISARTLFTLTKNGEVPHVRLGRRILYPAHELREWIGRKVLQTATSNVGEKPIGQLKSEF